MSSSAEGHLVGIDLGTTYSVLAHLDAHGNATTIPNANGDPLTPSIVYLDGNTAVVGRAAQEAASDLPANVAFCVKRDMGQRFYSRTLGGKTFHPETISAIILRKLVKDAERRIGRIRRAVITVPAFFNDARRKATQDAGRIAGLEVLDIINEPTAAALAYVADEAKQRGEGQGVLNLPSEGVTALVYDLGGGTFDVTVVRLAKESFDTLATDGAVQLGGKDWDQKIVEYVVEEFQRQFGVSPLGGSNSHDSMSCRLLTEAERVKKVLSTLPTATFECNYQGHSLRLPITREKFVEIARRLLSATQLVTDVVVKQARLTWDQIEHVLLVGGSTRMPMVSEMLTRVTGKKPDDRLDPDQVVARGAAIHAGIVAVKGKIVGLALDSDVQEELARKEVVNVNAYALGVSTRGKNGRIQNAVMIEKNTRLPCAATRVFFTAEAGATGVDVPVLEGDAEDADDNIQLGRCQIRGLAAGLPRGAPVQVRLAYNADGRVQVMALDMTNGKYAHVDIERAAGLTEAEIQREAAFVSSLNIN